MKGTLTGNKANKQTTPHMRIKDYLKQRSTKTLPRAESLRPDCQLNSGGS